ncbi:MAG: 30S ribosomal protein S12 methylthiotransferase RimO [Elusimicrobiota bacterium]|jgi:ribosomal protein S12 methylthiotransferase|nr:30S ribosomal protein S12 methylthiotransferase RimO [Elusimicrobiota bacterium]
MNFYLISLGCPKNLTDSEDFSARLSAAGSKLVFTPQEADVIIINTCGFLSSAINEARRNIRTALKLKEKGIVKKIAVTGCMVERLKENIKEEFPDLDLVFSISQQENIETIIDKRGEFIKPIGNRLYMPSYKMSLTLPHSAYLKIADGCNNRCAYCAIPNIRGAYRSKTMEEVLAEAKIMAQNGVKEISLIAQDTTSYGQDLYGKPRLVPLLKKLLKIKDLRRLRIMYVYPHRVTKELALLMASTDRIFHYLDMPLQHISESILKNMRRHCGADDIKKVLDMLKTTVADIALRTNFIVGFPGETEADFRELEKFVENYRFDNVGVFEYHRESGTPAYDMKGQIPARVKKERAERLNKVQSKVIDIINKSAIGKTVEVISDGETFGRTYKDAPDIDGAVIFSKPVKSGEIFKAKIIEAKGYKRVAKPRA